MSDKTTNKGFSNKIGFILSCVGSAVGMANIWMFPYRVGQNGGAVFLIIYLFFILLFSSIGLSAEFAIGRRSGTGTLGSYENAWNDIKKGKIGYLLAYIPLLGSMTIAIGYAIISAWVLRTLFGAVSGRLFLIPSEVFFTEATQAFGSLPWHIIIVIGTLLTLLLGAKSIEKTNKIMMPTFFVLFVILAIRVAFLPNAIEGYKYLFIPDWSYLFKPMTWIAAMGQAFFSLSITGSGMIVYGTYLSKDEDIVSGAKHTGIYDTLAAIISAFVVIPACFSFGISPSAGPPLMFITIPKILAQIPFGRALAILFFLSVTFAAVSSLQNMFEAVGESIQDRFKLSRKTIIVILAAVTLGIGIFIEAEPKVGMWMDIVTIYIIPFGALLGAITWFYVLKKEHLLGEINQGSATKHGDMFISMGKFVYVPLALGIFILGILYGGIG